MKFEDIKKGMRLIAGVGFRYGNSSDSPELTNPRKVTVYDYDRPHPYIIDSDGNTAIIGLKEAKYFTIDKEFNPKRGDRVIVNYCGLDIERIYLATIEGARAPYICVNTGHEKRFLAGEPFTLCYWDNIKPMPEIKVEIKVNGKAIEISEETMNAIIKASKEK